MRNELQSALALAKTLPADVLPEFLGDIEIVRTTALARLSLPSVPTAEDTLLEVPEAAARMSVSPAYLYRNHHRLPFTHREGRKLLFSSRGIDEYICRRRGR